MGYVYLIRDCDSLTYKIGVTKQKPEKRLKQLQTGNSCKLDLLYSFETDYPYRLEKMLHTYYSLYNEYNEWYNLNNYQITNFINTCNILQNNIKVLLQNPFFNKNIR